MINSKRIVSMAIRWKKIAIGRRRISLPRTVSNNPDAEKPSGTKSVASKGHFVVYTCDRRRFMIPLVYLSNIIFKELLLMAEEEFGLPKDGPIMLPCDSFFMDYIILIVRRGVSEDLQKAVVISLATGRCSVSSSFGKTQINNQFLVHGF
ncbi:Auxin-responsive protein saur66 [Thalictrum thalictroides]|uniref:Auxin-responsive protein saur66 n=1 Tax=Thalictrum thalictroides TaxID=46969 RepID=A0A7J6VLZ0_THATH|nr:Auxin-responsive protein saur66 [Thalictrum thalictroides]